MAKTVFALTSKVKAEIEQLLDELFKQPPQKQSALIRKALEAMKINARKDRDHA